MQFKIPSLYYLLEIPLKSKYLLSFMKCLHYWETYSCVILLKLYVTLKSLLLLIFFMYEVYPTFPKQITTKMNHRETKLLFFYLQIVFDIKGAFQLSKIEHIWFFHLSK